MLTLTSHNTNLDISAKQRKIRFQDDSDVDPDEPEKDTRIKFKAPVAAPAAILPSAAPAAIIHESVPAAVVAAAEEASLDGEPVDDDPLNQPAVSALQMKMLKLAGQQIPMVDPEVCQ